MRVTRAERLEWLDRDDTQVWKHLGSWLATSDIASTCVRRFKAAAVNAAIRFEREEEEKMGWRRKGKKK